MLISPLSAENAVIDVLLTTEPPMAGFTSFPVDGHGASFETATANERVRGRVKRVAIMAVLSRARAEALLLEIEARAPVPHLTYWIEPVLGFGRMRPVADAAGDGAGLDADTPPSPGEGTAGTGIKTDQAC